MSTIYVITRPEAVLECSNGADKLCCCLLENDCLTELFVDQQGQTLLGNIYVGKVKNILKNVDAAFVEIAGGQICFLPLSEAQRPVLTNRTYDGRLLAGDEILVQVKKDAVKTKDPVLTAKLSLTGTYVSVSLGEEKGLRYSQKLSPRDRSVLCAALTDIRLPREITAIIRTQAQELVLEDAAFSDLSPLKRELESLLGQAEKLLCAGRTRTVFSKLTEGVPGYLQRLQAFRSFPDKVVTDELSVFQTLQSYYKEHDPDRCSALALYRDERLSLSGLYGLSGKLSEAVSKNVWLRSGGYLVIEPTEALTVIDVNTGKYTGKKNTEETFAMINEEAALEVARQLRLRNLSGIIVVDFINMAGKEANQRLLSLLRRACCQDPLPVQVVDMTPLGLVEITRKKVSRPLAEQLRELKIKTRS